MDIFTPGAVEKAVSELDEIIASLKPISKQEELEQAKSTAKFLKEKIKRLEKEINN